MANHQWIRTAQTYAGSATGLISNTELYHNNSSASGSGQAFDATIVATHLFGVSDTDEIITIRLVVHHESLAAITESIPAYEDESTHGVYPFAKGPVLYSPRTKITVPRSHKLYASVAKKLGSNATNLYMYFNLLVVTH